MTLMPSTTLPRRRKNLAILGFAALIISTSTFFLASQGTLALPQAAIPAGTGAGGKIATFTALVPSLMSIPQGQGAQKLSGVLLGKVVVAAGFAPKLRVDISWLDPQNAGAVLNNPNAWMTFGLYYPIHTGVCTGSDPVNSQTITDSIQLCVTRNTEATGPLTFAGEISVNFQMLSGFILETKLDPATPSACGATGSTWCAPSGLGLSVNQNIFYITSSINTPGGIPPAQQSQLTTLNFYLGAHAF